MAAAAPPTLTPEEEAASQTDPMSGAVIRPQSAPQGTWNPAPILKQVLETPVPGVPPLWQSSRSDADQSAAKEWKPPDPVIKEPTAKVGAKEWTPPDPLIKDQRAAQPQKGWQPPDPVINEPQAAQPTQQPVSPPQPATAPTPQGPTTTESQTQTQPAAQLTIPTPTPQGPTTTEAPDSHGQIATLIAQGKTPGEAQAIVAGQEPKTLAGQTPKPAEPKPEQPAQPQGEIVNWADHGFQSFEQYQAFLDASGSGKAVRGPGTTATLVRAPTTTTEQPTTTEPQPTSPKIQLPAPTDQDEKPTTINGNRLYGTSTVFGLNYDRSIDPDDNGRGFFGGVNTRNPNLRAVAVPVDVLEGTFGKFTQKNAKGGYEALDTPEAKAIIAKIQSAHVELPDANGKMHKFPIVDIQGSLKGHPGKVLDLTYGAAKEMGFTDNHAVSYQIVGGDGKPYPIPEIELTGGGGRGGGGKGGPPAGGPGWTPLGGGALAGQPLFSIPTTGGGGGGSSAQPPSPRFGGGGGGEGAVPSETPQGGGGSIGLFPSFGGGGGRGAGMGGAAGSYAPGPVRRPEEESPVSSLAMYGGAPTPTGGPPPMKQANVLGITTVGGPSPAAPGAQAQLPAPTVTPKLLSAKQLMPGKVPKIVPPPAPSGTTQAGPDPSVVQGLMKRGFTRQQAIAFATKASVSAPGASATTRSASFRQPAAATPQARTTAPPPGPPSGEPAPSRQPTEFTGAPAGSTLANPTPPGHEKLSEIPKLVDQARHHASILSPDDPRVKKQPDGFIKGEHFVGGDPFHEQLLGGLPHGKQGRQGQILAQAEQAIGEKQPLHISYISAPKEAALHPTRESRTIQYEEHSPEARLMGTTEGQLVGHSMIPVSVGISPSRKSGEPHQGYIQGISTNVLANNFAHVNRKLGEMGQKSPYEKLGTKFTNDLEGYLSNLNAGHTGTGRGHAVGTAEYPNTADENHVPYHLTRREADFLNTVINNTAAFAKHEDGQALRRLAEANGTLITPEGETNRIRHEIEQHEPGWRHKVLEPSIRSFKTGLIHEVHPSEEHMPATIRPGKEYQDLTKAIQRTSERGRPDVAVSISPRSQPTASIPRDLAHNQLINRIEREFSEDRINEAEARQRLHAIGENPDEYRFVGGSGGLITPYEEDPEAITHEEHASMKDNLRKQWVGGKLNVEDYRRKVAEVPLPSKPSKPPVAALPATTPEETPKTPQTPAPAPKPLAPTPKPKPPPPAEPEEAPEEPAPAQPKPPAPGEPLPTPVKKPPAKTPKPIAPQEEKELTYKEMPSAQKEAYVSSRVKDRLANQIKGAVKLRPVMEGGKYKRDDAGNPQWEKDNYDLVNSPILGNKRLDRAKDQKFKDQEDIYGENEHAHLNDIDRKRLSYLEQKSAVDTMSDKIVDAYHKHMVNEPSVMAAKGWYTTMQQKLKKAFGPDAEIFAQLLGATSARTGVHQNFIQSLDAYDQLKNGNFDNHIAKYHEAHEHLAKGEGALAKHMHDSGIVQEMLDKGTMPIDKKTGKPKDLKTDAAAMAAWIAHHDILPRQKNGQKFNANSNQVLKVLAQKWLQSVKAPKTPNFAGNLSGRTREATIDVWAARFLHELGNEGNKKPWLLQPGGESGVRGLDFSFSQRAMRKAADKLGLSPDDLQAIAWYHQKHLWDQRGHTKGQGAKKASFDETFDRIFSPSGERLSDEEARKAFAGEKDEPVEEEEEEAA